MNIISIDLPWQETTKGGRALAIADVSGNVTILSATNDDELIEIAQANAEPESLVLLDVPIEGCHKLRNQKGKRFRLVDMALLRQRIGLLPSYNAGNRGKKLKERLQKTNKDIKVQEIYPYAIYKFLAYLKGKRKLHHLNLAKFESLLDEEFRRNYVPPKYKRERDSAHRLENIRYLYSLLTDSSFGLRFSSPLRYPETKLNELCDEYDACLGAIVGIYWAKNSPYACIAGDNQSGNILLLSDRWLVTQLEKEVKITKPDLD